MTAPLQTVFRGRPAKASVLAQDGKLWVFVGADYKVLTAAAADVFIRQLQSELARLRRQERRSKKAATKNQPKGDACTLAK